MPAPSPQRADRLSTVSATHAREVCGAQHGFGLEGLLQARAADLYGIMNGIDDTVWDPARDAYLDHRYSYADRGGKAACKAQLQRELGLAHDPEAPLMIGVCRLTWQKMADVLAQSLPAMLQRHPRLQIALHGRGEREVEQRLLALAGAQPGRVSVRIGYEEPAAHRLHAGGDVLLHGSRFEPCGLTQLYAMRYGALPVVTRVGGLADSVRDADEAEATGFVFDEPSGEAMAAAVERSVGLYESQPQRWRRMQDAAMRADFSWRESAGRYLDLYAQCRPALHAQRMGPLRGTPWPALRAGAQDARTAASARC